MTRTLLTMMWLFSSPGRWDTNLRVLVSAFVKIKEVNELIASTDMRCSWFGEISNCDFSDRYCNCRICDVMFDSEASVHYSLNNTFKNHWNLTSCTRSAPFMGLVLLHIHCTVVTCSLCSCIKKNSVSSCVNNRDLCNLLIVSVKNKI